LLPFPSSSQHDVWLHGLHASELLANSEILKFSNTMRDRLDLNGRIGVLTAR
jgi:hypothetical protein